MKKLQAGFLINWNRLLQILMSILGFSTAAGLGACDNNRYGPDEYGTPSAKFIVSGQVKAEQSSAAIPNIRVVMSGSSEYLADTTLTDTNGNYSLELTDLPTDQSFFVKFEDVDGSDNGEFQTLETSVDFTDAKFTDGSGWYEGETSQNLNVTLKDNE